MEVVFIHVVTETNYQLDLWGLAEENIPVLVDNQFWESFCVTQVCVYGIITTACYSNGWFWVPCDNIDWIMQTNNLGKSFIMKLNVSSRF